MNFKYPIKSFVIGWKRKNFLYKIFLSPTVILEIFLSPTVTNFPSPTVILEIFSKSNRDKIPKSNRDFGNFSKSNRDKKIYQVHSYKKSLLYDHIITVKNGFIDHIKYTVYCQNFGFCTVESGHIPTVKNEKLYGGI